jgi:hypothetical protein
MGRGRGAAWVNVVLWVALGLLGVTVGLAAVSEGPTGYSSPPGSAATEPTKAPPRQWIFAADFGSRRDPPSNPLADRYGNRRVWSFMAAGQRARGPSSFAALDRFERRLQGLAGFDAWVGADDAGGGLSFPIVGVKGDGTASSQGFAHPSNTRAAVIAWRSPIDASVRITGSVSDADAAAGDGVAWVLRSGTETLASGTIQNGGTIGRFRVSDVAVKIGDACYLKIAPRRDNAADSTSFSLRIAEERRPAGT